MSHFKPNYFQRRSKPKGPKANEKIRALDVQVIGSDGGNLGAMPLNKAIEIAKQEGLDLIENYAGKLPFWLSPSQAVVCTIAEENNDYVKKLFEDLFKEGIKCEVDLRNEKINYKIREHSLAKIPFIIVCGKKEVADNTVTVRKLGSEKQDTLKLQKAIQEIKELNNLPIN